MGCKAIQSRDGHTHLKGLAAVATSFASLLRGGRVSKFEEPDPSPRTTPLPQRLPGPLPPVEGEWRLSDFEESDPSPCTTPGPLPPAEAAPELPCLLSTPKSHQTNMVDSLPSCVSPRKATREQLLRMLFDALGPQGVPPRLGSSQLQRFAELCGFEGNNAEWAKEYQALCRAYGWDRRAGATFAQFTCFVDDGESSGYCSDRELLGLIVDPSLRCRNLATAGNDQEAPFRGVWIVNGIRCILSGEQLRRDDGTQIAIYVTSDTTIEMMHAGETLRGQLHADGRIYWSDGDMWTRGREVV